MTFFNRGKLPLSNNAIKCAVRCLQAEPARPDRAAIAIRQALCEDATVVFEVNNRSDLKGRISVDAPLTWVSGCCGSGKNELVHGASRSAARNGRRIVMITADARVVQRWHKADVRVIDLREIEFDQSVDLQSLIDASLEDGSIACLIILIPVLTKLTTEAAAAFDHLYPHVISRLPKGAFFIIDEVLLSHGTINFLRGMRNSLSSLGSYAMITCFRIPAACLPEVSSEDCYIQMRDACSPKAAVSCRSMREGEGLLALNGETIPIEGDYEFSVSPPLVLSDHVLSVIKRLEERLMKGVAQGHIAHLEAVARSCGYRSWHAAQGRRTE